MKSYPKLKVFFYFCCAPAIGGVVAHFCIVIGLSEYLMENHNLTREASGFIRIFNIFPLHFCRDCHGFLYHPGRHSCIFVYSIKIASDLGNMCLDNLDGRASAYLWVQWIIPITNLYRPWLWGCLFFFSGAISSLIISVMALPVREVANQD